VKRGLIICGVILAAAFVWLGYQQIGSRQPQGQPPLANLTQETLQQLRAEFNRDADEVRIVLLVSPT